MLDLYYLRIFLISFLHRFQYITLEFNINESDCFNKVDFFLIACFWIADNKYKNKEFLVTSGLLICLNDILWFV